MRDVDTSGRNPEEVVVDYRLVTQYKMGVGCLKRKLDEPLSLEQEFGICLEWQMLQNKRKANLGETLAQRIDGVEFGPFA